MHRPAPTTNISSRTLLVGVREESELVLHGLRSMLAPHSSAVSLVGIRADQPAPPCDLTLFEPAAPHRAPGSPLRVPGRSVAYSWDCSPDAVSTAMSRGAAGFVSKWLPAHRMVRDLLQIADGRVVIDTWTGRKVGQGGPEQRWPLTQRETEVLAFIAAGRSNQEIVDETLLSINSVKSYIRSAYSKIGVTSRSQAVLWAVRHGLLLSTEADDDGLRLVDGQPTQRVPQHH
ncbi:DNA-binding CsgD family transcriptional regulator [Nocardioides sp. BE266]|uniref:response regulator transcription factor n=1 Tax=Nocardioides sp. BE266 TaxID=2817725 RepID=UPI00285E3922|nr:response regulator transcription factor [Nocardioides sp. BE266]MDR7254809.1 DNA-binding CsgD family transcriptional regulator [Nocardioides sp. BE266]